MIHIGLAGWVLSIVAQNFGGFFFFWLIYIGLAGLKILKGEGGDGGEVIIIIFENIPTKKKKLGRGAQALPVSVPFLGIIIGVFG